MRDLELTASFDRFRREGDPAALAYVFDHAAPELLRVARHLTRSVETSEDLLQSTFVAAIEGREGFDASRRVEAWLIGILIHQAGLAYRKASRNLEVERLPSAEVEEPIDRLVAEELKDEISRAIRSLPPVYREVLEPKLERELRSVEIARAVGRTPSVVRTQVLRGMELLRRALPPGLASLLLLSLSSRRSLASVRDRVVEHAIANVGLHPSAAASVPASALVGGIVMLKKALFVAALVVFAVGSAWYLGLIASPDLGSSGEREAVQVPPPAAAPREEVSDPVGERPREIARSAAPTKTDAGPPESFTRHLSGMRGRLVEADGTPVTDTRLVVRQLDMGTAFERGSLSGSAGPGSRSPQASEEPLLTVDDTMTDSDGRFFIHGIRPQGTVGLVVDPGGARAALKLLEIDPPRGATVDVGDVALAPACRLEGVVIDTAGAPVAGARVRAGLVQTAVTMFGLQHYRSGDGFFMALPDAPLCGDLPGWIDRMIVELIPSTTTDARGRFQLPRVSEGPLNVMVDAPGHAAVETTVRCRRGVSNDAGEIQIGLGITRDGRVVDEHGVGLGGVSVRVGFASTMGVGAVMREVGETDPAGRIRAEHTPEGAGVFLAARLAEHHPWKVTGPLSSGDDLILALPPTVDLPVRCIDAEGEPVTDVEFLIAPVGSGYDPLSGLRPWSMVAPTPDVETEDGTYGLLDLAEGAYRLRATSRTRGVIEQVLRIPDEGVAGDGQDPLTLVFTRPRSILVRVIDEATGGPVEWARATLHPLDSGDALYHGTCDHDGQVTLGAFGAHGDDACLLRVEHPGFGRIVTEVVPGGAPVTVALRPGGEVRGQVLSRGAAPETPLAVTLRLADGQPGVSLERDLPWTQRIDDEGRFAIDSLPAGHFVVTVAESHADLDGLSMFAFSVADPLGTTELDVSAGAVTEVTVDVSPSPAEAANERGTATLRGQVRVTGGDAPPFTVMVFGGGKMQRVAADRSGTYLVTGIPPGQVRLSLGTPNAGPSNALPRLFLNREVELQRGEVRTLDFDLTLIEVPVLVVDRSTGLPARGVAVTMTGTGAATSGFRDRATTGADGVASLLTFAAGEYALVADAEGVGRGTTTLAITTVRRAAPVRIELDAGVACAGRFLFPDGVVIDPEEGVEILLSGEGFQRVLEAEGGDVRFEVRGASPGSYTVLVYLAESGREYTGSFELPATGKADLLIPVHVPR